ncbi:hypothetical protein CC707_20835 [Salmonella enterica subsp. enterica serovar Panama]|uniref:Uncharacterized protein n=1 Tax=Salmonella enterica subsp. enterica serovar Panama TaxID=29472 RepID=A0A636GDJ4_SALET|nr:hypothetical protein [Salmonella enterica subsp. enterica serovar Panama]
MTQVIHCQYQRTRTPEWNLLPAPGYMLYDLFCNMGIFRFDEDTAPAADRPPPQLSGLQLPGNLIIR